MSPNNQKLPIAAKGPLSFSLSSHEIAIRFLSLYQKLRRMNRQYIVYMYPDRELASSPRIHHFNYVYLYHAYGL